MGVKVLLERSAKRHWAVKVGLRGPGGSFRDTGELKVRLGDKMGLFGAFLSSSGGSVFISGNTTGWWE